MADSHGLQVLQRQFFQLVDPHQLRWPDSSILKKPDTQAWMYAHMFDASSIKSPPPDRYQLRVLKLLISKLERAIENPEEDVRLPFSSPLIQQIDSLDRCMSALNRHMCCSVWILKPLANIPCLDT
jgi:hypothetical protein